MKTRTRNAIGWSLACAIASAACADTLVWTGKYGTMFDSSVKRGEPAEFGVNQVIAGWVEALQLMGEGAKWRLFIPSELAYGAQGAGASVPPHATLIFDVELLKVLK